MTPRIPTIAIPKLRVQLKTYWVWLGLGVALLLSLLFSILGSRPGHLFFPLRQIFTQSNSATAYTDQSLQSSVTLVNEYVSYLDSRECSLYVYTSREIASEMDQIIRNLATRYGYNDSHQGALSIDWESLLFTETNCADTSKWFEYYVLISDLSLSKNFDLDSKWQTQLAVLQQELLTTYQQSTFQIQERLDRVNQLILLLQQANPERTNYELYLILQELQLTLESNDLIPVQTYNYHALAKLSCRFMPELGDCNPVNFIANWNSILSSQDSISEKLLKGETLWVDKYFSKLPIQLQKQTPNSFPQSFATDQN